MPPFEPACRVVSRTACLLLLLLLSAAAHAQEHELIAYWHFNDPASTGTPWPQPLAADRGAGTLTYSFASGLETFAGTIENARDGAPAGSSLTVQGGPGLANNGGYLEIQLSAAAYERLVLSYATRGTGTGFDTQRAAFSVDGGQTWTEIGTETRSRQTTYFVVRYDLSDVAALDRAPNVRFRLTFSGATHENGNNRIDNLAVEGVFVGAASASGTGTVQFEEDALVRGGQDHTLDLVVRARSDDEADRLDAVTLVLPPELGAPAAVELEPAGGTVALDGRTVAVTGVAISQSAPLRVRLRDVAVPDASGAYVLAAQTGAGGQPPAPVAQEPELLVWSTPEPIAAVRTNDPQGRATRLGEWVTVRGVVTAADQFRTGGGQAGPSFLQDDSAGLAVFSPSGVSERVTIGDEVILLGRVAQFNGLNQLDSRTVVVETLRRGVPVEPEVVTLAQLAADGQGGVEVYEGRLVRVNDVTVNTATWTLTGSGSNYTLTDATGTLTVRVVAGVDFAGQPAPAGPFDVVGVVGQFRPSAPFIGGYQLQPRRAADLLDDRDAPAFTSPPPFERAATPTSVTFAWTTDRPARAEVFYVPAPGDTVRVTTDGLATEHVLTLGDLAPATIYDVTLCATATERTCVRDYPVATTAPPGTTHRIRVVFNGTVDRSLARETEAESANPLPILLDLLNNAERSIDMALYSLSGGVGAEIAEALIAARNRGVRVRVIMNEATSNTAPPRRLRNAAIPFITNAFGGNDGEALHHNKVAIVDALTDPAHDPARVWVMTGSWNPTDPGTFEHHQNILFIQDGALAAAYTREFEQMWGGSGLAPNPSASRFGARKRQTAPTVFWIGDVYTRLFFSPQGFGRFGTTEEQIIAALREAEHDIDLGLNLITRASIVDAIRERHTAGVRVRGAVGEPGTTGSVFALLAAFADVHAHDRNRFGLLHHKYAIVDAEHPGANPAVITGAHNWSRAANERNDENTLILYSADLANQFRQEFAVRYREAGGTAEFGVTTEEAAVPATFSVSANHPNPVTVTTTFAYTLPAPAEVTITVYDLLGREVLRTTEPPRAAGTHTATLDVRDLPSGVYVYRVVATAGAQRYAASRRMVVVR